MRVRAAGRCVCFGVETTRDFRSRYGQWAMGVVAVWQRPPDLLAACAAYRGLPWVGAGSWELNARGKQGAAAHSWILDVSLWAFILFGSWARGQLGVWF
jgi:hypothetical protein